MALISGVRARGRGGSSCRFYRREEFIQIYLSRNTPFLHLRFWPLSFTLFSFFFLFCPFPCCPCAVSLCYSFSHLLLLFPIISLPCVLSDLYRVFPSSSLGHTLFAPLYFPPSLSSHFSISFSPVVNEPNDAGVPYVLNVSFFFEQCSFSFDFLSLGFS